MRRRRRKNPLLTRIILISVVVHAIALPIAAHYGAFEKIGREFGASRVVMITTRPLEEKKRATKSEKKPKKSSPTSKKGPNNAHRFARRASQKPNPFQPKVIASSVSGGAAGESPTVSPNGTGKAGVLPTGPAAVAPGATAPADPGPERTKPVEPSAVPAPATSPAPEPKPAAPEPKKFVQVETTYAPEPVIPDDLRTEPLDKTLVIEADVSTTGSPENVRIGESTGNRELDSIGLDTAKRYRFKPALLGDSPVLGHVRFRIIFKVE